MRGRVRLAHSDQQVEAETRKPAEVDGRPQRFLSFVGRAAEVVGHCLVVGVGEEFTTGVLVDSMRHLTGVLDVELKPAERLHREPLLDLHRRQDRILLTVHCRVPPQRLPGVVIVRAVPLLEHLLNCVRELLMLLPGTRRQFRRIPEDRPVGPLPEGDDAEAQVLEAVVAPSLPVEDFRVSREGRADGPAVELPDLPLQHLVEALEVSVRQAPQSSTQGLDVDLTPCSRAVQQAPEPSFPHPLPLTAVLTDVRCPRALAWRRIHVFDEGPPA
ncbi:hypothetical protein Y09_1528 [Brachybacterium sp. SW0106-09]|nr:hypothetical protein Y09_1528 [Brachybacterium sp. SW0106-09]